MYRYPAAATAGVLAAAAFALTGCGTLGDQLTDTAEAAKHRHTVAESAATSAQAAHQHTRPASAAGDTGGPDEAGGVGRETQAHVTRVVDGDTIIATTDGGKQRVRVLGIDTPETVHPSKPVECYGPEASDFAHEVLAGETVTLRTDPTQQDTDRYDRALRYIDLPDGSDYSIMAARGGYAEPYVYKGNPVREAETIAAAADDARAAGRGLWAACPHA